MLFYFITLKLAWVLQKDDPVSREVRVMCKYMQLWKLEIILISCGKATSLMVWTIVHNVYSHINTKKELWEFLEGSIR